MMWLKAFKFMHLLLLALLFLTTGCAKSAIVNGLEEKETNEILVLLASKDIDADKAPGGEITLASGNKVPAYNVLVSESDTIEAMSILNRYGLPRKRGQTLLDIFPQTGLVPSESQEKIRYHAGLESQLASIIRKIDGVVDADVQLSIPQANPLTPDAPVPKARASIFVKHLGILDDPNSHLITKIKRLIASSVPDLDFDNVSVIPVRARYADISVMTSPEEAAAREPAYVQVWGLVIAKDSLSFFRFIFFTLSILALLLLFCTGWLLWKIFPFLQGAGGWKELLTSSPFGISSVKSGSEEGEEEEEGEEGEEEEYEEEEVEQEEDFEEEDEKKKT